MYPEARQQIKGITLEGLPAVAHDIIDRIHGYRVCLLTGDMGAGKTTLVKALCHVLGVEDVMSSPTFSIVNEYRSLDGRRIFHFDFYRIRSEAEAFDIGTEEYFYSGDYCFVEWPEKIPSLLPEQYVTLALQVEDAATRTLDISFHGRQEEKRI